MEEMSFFNPKFRNLCDAEVETEDGHTFQVHRIILAMKSEYFCSMFCGMNEDRRQFKIPGISGNCLTEILKYIYTGKILDAEQQACDPSDLMDLMIAADYLCLQDLCLLIKEHFKETVTNGTITISNCLPMLNAAYNFEEEGILRKSFRFVKTKFGEIMRTRMNEVAELSLDVLKKILGSRNLNVSSEKSIWLAIVQWTSKDMEYRSECVSRLLMCLARKKLSENLAEEILQHKIVSDNSYMKDLNELKDSPYFTSSLDALLHYLENKSNSFKQPLPEKLNVIAKKDGDFICSLYITYDENIDLWRKLGEYCSFFITCVAHNVYLFGLREFVKFDLISRKWMSLSFPPNTWEDLRYQRSVFQIDGFIYIIGQCLEVKHVVIEIYDTQLDRWLDRTSLNNLHEAKSVAFNKKIYVIGEDMTRKMTNVVFDTLNKKWETISPPRIRRRLFSLIVYSEKVYLIGGRNCNTLKPAMEVEVFDPKTNLWKDLPKIPFNSITRAVVFDDKLIAYDDLNPSKAIYWNGVRNQWKEFESSSRIDFSRFVFTTVDDEETIRTMMKVNEDPETSWQKSPFDFEFADC